jgi:hypothetical protein
MQLLLSLVLGVWWTRKLLHASAFIYLGDEISTIREHGGELAWREIK